jgi:hypothetical protein
MRAGLECDEWPDLDLEGRFANAELELAQVSFDRFVESGEGFSLVRSFFNNGRFARVRNTYGRCPRSMAGFALAVCSPSHFDADRAWRTGSTNGRSRARCSSAAGA